MLLRKARVTNFKIVEDSNEFMLDRVTCLIGKNESGKTAILDALHRLNPYDAELSNIPGATCWNMMSATAAAKRVLLRRAGNSTTRT